MKKLILYALCTFFLFTEYIHAQADSYSVPNDLVGYWTGALIAKDNSIQSLEVEISRKGDSLFVESAIPDWAFYPPKRSLLKLNNDQIQFSSYYGEMALHIDSAYSEMLGELIESELKIKVHLKKSLKPPGIKILERELAIENQGAKISGTLYMPQFNNRELLSCAVFVHGRGCGNRNSLTSQAKKFAEYGLATFVYDKRGSKESGYDCSKATHDQNVADVNTILEVLSRQDGIDPKKIGLISYSAGGWIAHHLTQKSKKPIAFLITNVGPSTSVLDQQLDGLEAFLEAENLSEASIADAKEYTRLLFTRSDQSKAYARCEVLLDKAKADGWDRWLEDDDYIKGVNAFNDLWVQRFSYDPSKAIRSYQGPFLAIFGEEDLIVPYEIQINKLHSLKGEPGEGNYEYKVISKAGHGLESGATIRRLKGLNQSPQEYFKYDRVAYGVISYPIAFLRKHGFIGAD